MKESDRKEGKEIRGGRKGEKKKRKFWTKEVWEAISKKYLLPCFFIGVAQLRNKHTAQRR